MKETHSMTDVSQRSQRVILAQALTYTVDTCASRWTSYSHWAPCTMQAVVVLIISYRSFCPTVHLQLFLQIAEVARGPVNDKIN